ESRAFEIAADCIGGVSSDSLSPGSIAFNLQRLQEAARSLSDRLPTEVWRIVLNLGFDPPDPGSPDWALDWIEMMQALLVKLAALESLCRQTIPISPTSDFLEIGQRIERGMQTAMLLRNALFHPECSGFQQHLEAKSHLLA